MEDRVKRLRALPPDKIALKLKAYRREYGLTQEFLAKRIGVPRLTLLRWENGQSRISNMMLKVLVLEGVL